MSLSSEESLPVSSQRSDEEYEDEQPPDDYPQPLFVPPTKPNPKSETEEKPQSTKKSKGTAVVSSQQTPKAKKLPSGLPGFRGGRVGVGPCDKNEE